MDFRFFFAAVHPIPAKQTPAVHGFGGGMSSRLNRRWPNEAGSIKQRQLGNHGFFTWHWRGAESTPASEMTVSALSSPMGPPRTFVFWLTDLGNQASLASLY
jgi:hypothetical protein